MVLWRILGLMVKHLSVKAAFDEAVDQIDEILSTLEIDGAVKAASSMNRGLQHPRGGCNSSGFSSGNDVS